MFVAGDNLYWSTPSNDLRRIGWAQGAQSGTPGRRRRHRGVEPDRRRLQLGLAARAVPLPGQGRRRPVDRPDRRVHPDVHQPELHLRLEHLDRPGHGTITGRSWNFGDGTTSTEANPTHAFPATGTYQVALTVTSSKGLTNTVTKAVQVTRVNQNPTADFTVACNQLTCTFDAVGSDGRRRHRRRATRGTSVTAPPAPAARSTTPTPRRAPATSPSPSPTTRAAPAP